MYVQLYWYNNCSEWGPSRTSYCFERLWLLVHSVGIGQCESNYSSLSGLPSLFQAHLIRSGTNRAIESGLMNNSLSTKSMQTHVVLTYRHSVTQNVKHAFLHTTRTRCESIHYHHHVCRRHQITQYQPTSGHCSRASGEAEAVDCEKAPAFAPSPRINTGRSTCHGYSDATIKFLSRWSEASYRQTTPVAAYRCTFQIFGQITSFSELASEKQNGKNKKTDFFAADRDTINYSLASAEPTSSTSPSNKWGRIRFSLSFTMISRFADGHGSAPRCKHLQKSESIRYQQSFKITHCPSCLTFVPRLQWGCSAMQRKVCAAAGVNNKQKQSTAGHKIISNKRLPFLLVGRV